MREAEVRALFTQGMKLFNNGQPCPPEKDRIRFMGWKTASQAQKVIDQGIDNAIEAYVDLEREIEE